MNKSKSDEDTNSVEGFKKTLLSSFSKSPKHKRAIKTLCVGETVEEIRTNVNRNIRVSVSLTDSPNTCKKRDVLQCLDVRSPVDEWVKDFSSVVVPYVSERVDPSDISK